MYQGNDKIAYNVESFEVHSVGTSTSIDFISSICTPSWLLSSIDIFAMSISISGIDSA